jgi:hypothetical protein
MMAWSSVPDVRKIAGVTTSDFSDAQIQDFIVLAQKEVNSRILTRVVREPVIFIDSYRSNKIDGSNTTYFIKNWEGNYLADTNYDNTITISDVNVVQYNANTQVESAVTLSSINVPSCSFTVTSAVSNVSLFVDYGYVGLDPVTPHPLLWNATTYLAASYLFIGNDGFKITFGNVTIEPGKDGGKGKQLYDKFLELMNQLNVNLTGGSLWSDMAIKI